MGRVIQVAESGGRAQARATGHALRRRRERPSGPPFVIRGAALLVPLLATLIAGTVHSAPVHGQEEVVFVSNMNQRMHRRPEIGRIAGDGEGYYKTFNQHGAQVFTTGNATGYKLSSMVLNLLDYEEIDGEHLSVSLHLFGDTRDPIGTKILDFANPTTYSKTRNRVAPRTFAVADGTSEESRILSPNTDYVIYFRLSNPGTTRWFLIDATESNGEVRASDGLIGTIGNGAYWNRIDFGWGWSKKPMETGNLPPRSMKMKVLGTLARPTASFSAVPHSHYGGTAFTVDLRFSEILPLTSEVLQDALTVTGGAVTAAQKAGAADERTWRITVQPSSRADVTVVLAAGESCGEAGTVCTGDGRPLAAEVTAEVVGPMGMPEIAGVAQPGGTLEATFAQAPPGTLAWQWMRGSKDIAGAHASTYTLTGKDAGARISVRVERYGESVVSASTEPVWPAPANPPLAHGEEELLSTTVTLGSHEFKLWLAGYGRVLEAPFGDMDEISFEDGGTAHSVNLLAVNWKGQFILGTGSALPEAPGLVAYWNGHRITGLQAITASPSSNSLRLLVGRTPQPSAEYRRYWEGASDGVRVAVSLRRTGVAPHATGASVTSSPGHNGTWDTGETVEAEVRFSEAATVEGARGAKPALGIVLGGARREAAYTGGSGTSAFQFVYRVTAQDNGANRARVAQNELSLNGATLRDVNGRDVETTGFAVAPYVTRVVLVADDSGDGVWSPGERIEVRVVFSEAVTVKKGTPWLIVSDKGAQEGYASYVWGSGSETLVFKIEVTDNTGNSTGLRVLADSLNANRGAIVSEATGLAAELGHDAVEAAEAEVVQPELNAVTAEFHDWPAEHNQEEFRFRIRFSKAFTLSYRTLRDHALSVTNGTLSDVSRENQGEEKDREWNVTVTPDGSGYVAVTLAATTDCAAVGAICTEDGWPLSTAVTAVVLAEEGEEIPANTPATGIAGSVRVGETLTATTAGTDDADGLTGAAFAYQWLAGDSDMQGATNSNYTLVGANEGETVKVRVTFTDDLGNEETLTSAATASVAALVLTARFEDPPAEHDGSTFEFRLRFSEEFPLSWRTLRDHALDVTGGRLDGVSRVTRGENREWNLTVTPAAQAGDVTVTLAAAAECGAAGAICTADARALSNSPAVTVAGPAGISVADAQVEEAEGAMLGFAVTLERAATGTVTVDYATSNGSATAGADYRAASGTLTFAAGETRKKVSVEVLDDSHNDGGETLILTLSNASGAYLADSTATGTIDNADPMPSAWLARFGRTASVHTASAIQERLHGGARDAQENHFTLGGRRMDQIMEALRNGDDSQEVSGEQDTAGGLGLNPLGGLENRNPIGGIPDSASRWPLASPSLAIGRTGMTVGAGNSAAGSAAGDMPAAHGPSSRVAGTWVFLEHLLSTGLPNSDYGDHLSSGRPLFDLLSAGQGDWRDLLMGSSFHHHSGALDKGSKGPLGLSDWSAWGSGAQTHFNGADGELSINGAVSTATVGADAEWGRLIAGVAVSHSFGEGLYTHETATGGQVTSQLTSLNPYANFALNDRTSLWGAVGYGVGELGLKSERSENTIETGLETTMAAFGGRGVFSHSAAGLQLAVVSDALFTNTVSEAATGLAGAEGAASRMRLMLEGSGSMQLWNGGVLRPTLEAGVRYDGGDAETGAGVEIGGGLAYTAGRVSVQVNARGLVAHEDTEFEEWGLSGMLKWQPNEDGRGLSMDIGSSWGAVQSGVQGLWSQADAAGLARGGAMDASQRFQAQLGYGFEGRKGRALWVPFFATDATAGAQAYRMGLKLTSGSAMELGLELGRRAMAGGDPEEALKLDWSMRW